MELEAGETSCARQRTCSWRRGSGRGGKSKWAATAASAGGLKFKAGRVGCVERPLPRLASLSRPAGRWEGVPRAAGAGIGDRQGSARDGPERSVRGTGAWAGRATAPGAGSAGACALEL